jgi:hypothetical protein
MPKNKPDNRPAYLRTGPQPLDPAARARRNAEVKANCYAFLKLLGFSVILGLMLAFCGKK